MSYVKYKQIPLLFLFLFVFMTIHLFVDLRHFFTR